MRGDLSLCQALTFLVLPAAGSITLIDPHARQEVRRGFILLNSGWATASRPLEFLFESVKHGFPKVTISATDVKGQRQN